MTQRSSRSDEGADSRILLTPLTARSRDEFRPRRTARPLLRRLSLSDEATAWGIRISDEASPGVVASRNGDGRLHVDTEASRLVVLHLGPACGPERRREALLEARDWTDPAPDETALARDTESARRLVDRCTRRIRRRGSLKDGRWRL